MIQRLSTHLTIHQSTHSHEKAINPPIRMKKVFSELQNADYRLENKLLIFVKHVKITFETRQLPIRGNVLARLSGTRAGALAGAGLSLDTIGEKRLLM